MPVSQILVDKNVAVPMRDGVVTYGDLYRPSDGEPVPAIICRTPYSKEQVVRSVVNPTPLALAEQGYAVLVTDVRGRFASEGKFEPFLNEAQDGYDTIEWAAAQPWCDGNTANYGLSYYGATTLLAARERPPSLRCSIPIITADDYFDGWTYQGGAFELGFAGTWGMGLAAAQLLREDNTVPEGEAMALAEAMADPIGTLSQRPISMMPGISEPGVADFWEQWTDHDTRDDYWEELRHSKDYSRFDVPMMFVGGWFDIFGLGTVRNFLGMTAEGKAQHHLWMGPWAHTSYDRYLGEMDFGGTGPAIMCGIGLVYLDFLNKHLKRIEPATPMPTVSYFVLGANEWRQADAWPPPEGREYPLYLHSRGWANSARGDGALADATPDRSEPSDRYLYDPLRPVPSEGGPILQISVGQPGPRDQRDIEERDDVLCYTTGPLDTPLTIAGPVTVDLWATTDGPDTDWTAKLVDLQPDGKAVSLCDGIIRARFRESFSDPTPVTPGEPTRYRIDLASTAHRFGIGHRVRLEISSSNFPRFDPNPNTGGRNLHERETRPAVQHVLHNSEHPSRLNLWALPG